MIEIPAFLTTPRGLAIAVVALIALAVVIKVASLVVRVLALLVSLAMIGLLMMRFRAGNTRVFGAARAASVAIASVPDAAAIGVVRFGQSG